MKIFCPYCGIEGKHEFERNRLEVMGRMCDVVFFICQTCGLMVDIVIQGEPK